MSNPPHRHREGEDRSTHRSDTLLSTTGGGGLGAGAGRAATGADTSTGGGAGDGAGLGDVTCGAGDAMREAGAAAPPAAAFCACFFFSCTKSEEGV